MVLSLASTALEFRFDADWIRILPFLSVVIDLEDFFENNFFAYYFLKVHLHRFSNKKVSKQ
jgi:hypothetical protein